MNNEQRKLFPGDKYAGIFSTGKAGNNPVSKKILATFRFQMQHPENSYDVIVIGAGAAGLIAAGRAAELGARVLLLEKMERPARKLLITGKGRCNITNDRSVPEFLQHVHPNGRILRYAFSQFYQQEMLELLHQNGLETKLERGGRYFPVSDKASDVADALLNWNKKNRVTLQTRTQVKEIGITDNRVAGVRINDNPITDKLIHAPAVILATGGKSYPATGSTGEGYALAEQCGHTVTPVRPALVPLETAEPIPEPLLDLTLKNINTVLWVDGKKAGEAFGELMFIPAGLSGPTLITLSRTAVDALLKKQQVTVTIDLKPALDEQKLDARLLRDLNANGTKTIRNLFPSWVPRPLVPVFLDILKLDPSKACHQVTSGDRKAIRYLLKNWKFTITRPRPYKEAIVTAGGVRVNEIDQKTMGSKKVTGLYLAGEVLDLDGDTGGYNLQIAWSTGWMAGDAAANSLRRKSTS